MKLELQYKNKLIAIEKYLKVFKIESCLLIYFYLMIYGKNIPNRLKSELGISKATVFRSLGFLLDAGFVNKEEIDSSPDKRSNVFYYVSKPILEICSNVNFSQEFEEYARMKGSSNILDNWKSIVEKSTSIFSNSLARIFELQRKKAKSVHAIAKAIVCDDCGKIHIPEAQKEKQRRRIQLFTIMESPDEDIFQKLQKFLSSLQIKTDVPQKEGEKMKNPLSLAIDIIEL
ncbi:MAG: hypothetical protein ACFFBD_11360 [Candidatus Hodarchaeota archaeon]